MAGKVFPKTLGTDDAEEEQFQPAPEDLQALQSIRARQGRPAPSQYSPEQVAQRRNMNQRQYALGALAMMSNNEDLQQAGAVFFKQALAERQPHITEHGTSDQLSGEFTYDPDYLQQRNDDQTNAVLNRIGAQRVAFQQGRTAAKERAAQAHAHDEVMAGIAGTRAEGVNARAQAAQDARDQAEKDRQAKVLDSGVQSFERRTEAMTPVVFAANEVQRMLEKYGDKSIPGVGYDAMLGPMNTTEGVLNRQKVSIVANALLKAASGQAVTLNEEQRKAAETLASGRYSEREFRGGWPLIRDSINTSVGNTRAGYTPEVVKTFEGRGGHFAPVLPAGAASSPTGSTDPVREELARILAAQQGR